MARLGGRPLNPVTPGRSVQLSVQIAAEEKIDAVRAATEAGRSLSREVEHRLRWYRDQEARLGGRRLGHLLQILAETAQKMYGPGDAWLDDAQDYEDVLASWQEVLINHAPYNVDDEIANGRSLIADLPRCTPSMARRLRDMLFLKSRLTRLPDDIRTEFAAAAEPTDGELPPLLSEAQISKVAHEMGVSRVRAREILTDGQQDPGISLLDLMAAPTPSLSALVQPLLTAWIAAKTMLIGLRGQEPDEAVIAAYIANSPELRLLAGRQTTLSANEILEQRAAILALDASPTADSPS